MSEKGEEVSWWNRNIPEHERTLECPDFLRNATERQKLLIGQLDRDHIRMSWQEVKDFVGKFFVIFQT
jgi:hypothetical protein